MKWRMNFSQLLSAQPRSRAQFCIAILILFPRDDDDEDDDDEDEDDDDDEDDDESYVLGNQRPFSTPAASHR
eukprot:5057047-Amphidinium_carterae.1